MLCITGTELDDRAHEDECEDKPRGGLAAYCRTRHAENSYRLKHELWRGRFRLRYASEGLLGPSNMHPADCPPSWQRSSRNFEKRTYSTINPFKLRSGAFSIHEIRDADRGTVIRRSIMQSSPHAL